MSESMFKRVTIIGVGLIGASLAMAMKRASIVDEIVGTGRSEDNLKKAKELGVIDIYSKSLIEAVDSSDIVVLASPVGTFSEIVDRIRGHLKEGAVVTDVGSVKGTLVTELEAKMPEGRFFVGAHPIAGSDRSGLEYADSDLFRDSVTVITPTDNTSAGALKKVELLWRAVGAKVIFMSPSEHDRVLALTSHLPHVISYALVNTVAAMNTDYFSYTGGGFKDTTRIASSSPELWVDILLSNKDNVLEMIKIFKERLYEIESALEDGDAKGLQGLFEKAKRMRDKIN